MTRPHAAFHSPSFHGSELFHLIFPFLALLAFLALPRIAHGADIYPFYTLNQSPLVQIYGLPALDHAVVTPPGHFAATFATDLASNFGVDDSGNESIILDGETYRTTLAMRYGVGKGWEVGIDVPWVSKTGGILDGFVSGFHSTFGLDQSGRDDAPKNQLLFRYQRDGVEKLSVGGTSSGLGDIRLSTAFQIYQDEESPASAIALRAAVKLPTGASSHLRGSGGADFALWLSGADSYEAGDGFFGLFAGAGGVILGQGDVLPDMQRELVAFGTIGIGWSPMEWLVLKTQLYSHSPFYRNSSLHELGVTALQWLAGATFAFTDKTSLDLGVSEDLAIVAASPDVVFHFALRTLF